MVESISQFDLQQRGSEDERTSSLRARLMLLEGNLEVQAGGLTLSPICRRIRLSSGWKNLK